MELPDWFVKVCYGLSHIRATESENRDEQFLQRNKIKIKTKHQT
jgi:hypothetical protein